MQGVFADYNSTTPIVDPVKKRMNQLTDMVGNSSSIHKHGQLMQSIYDESVDNIKSYLGCPHWEFLSCSSATEANNWIFYSLLHNIQGCPRVITSAIEHASVLGPLKQYANEGLIDLKVCSVDERGFLDMNEFESLLTNDTVLVSVILANNEIGSIQPLGQISKMAKAVGAFVHSDIVQGLGKMPINLVDLDVDAVSISGHKCYAPVGCAALIIQSVNRVRPLMLGGSHQQMLRAGSINVMGMACFSEGLDYCYDNYEHHVDVMVFVRQLKSRFPNIVVISEPNSVHNLWNTVNISIPGHDAHNLMMALDMRGVSIATGSACSTGAIDISPVIQALNVSHSVAAGAIRFSFGYPTTIEDFEFICSVISDIN